ncbi:MAG: TM1812 family CRISPR-associated protein [Nitrososphaerota archaeon]
MNAQKTSLLIMAPIGDPSGWRLANYYIQDKRYSTCCSAIALALHNSQRYNHIHLQIYVLDSLTCSPLLGKWSEDQPLQRQVIKQVLEKSFKEEVLKAAQRSGIGVQVGHNGAVYIGSQCTLTISVHISQAAGEYAVNREGAPVASAVFNGDPTSIFTKIISSVITLPEYGDILLDLTHGINYMQSMAVYAVEILKNLIPVNVRVHNASPYPSGVYQTTFCFPTTVKQVKQNIMRNQPDLMILDLSGLQHLWDLSASFSNLTLTRKDVETIRKALNHVISQLKLCSTSYNVLQARHTVLAWYYLAAGVITIGYINAVKSFKETVDLDNIQQLANKIEEAEIGFDVEGDNDRIIFKYRARTDWRFAVPFIVWYMRQRLAQVISRKDIKETDKITVNGNELITLLDGLSNVNPLYMAVGNALRYERDRILQKSRDLKMYEFSMERSEYRKLFFGTDSPLSQLKLSEMKRHLQAHVGITYEPVTHIKITDNEVQLTLRVGDLGEDPYNVWPK